MVKQEVTNEMMLSKLEEVSVVLKELWKLQDDHAVHGDHDLIDMQIAFIELGRIEGCQNIINELIERKREIEDMYDDEECECDECGLTTSSEN